MKWETQPQTDEEFNTLEWEKANGYGILLNGQKDKNGLYTGVIDYDPKPKPNETEEETKQRLEAIERAKKFLNDNGVEYEYVDVDLCSQQDRNLIRQDIQNRGGRLAYPTIIVDHEILLTGASPDKLREVLEI